ncbi:SSI family serine proteinase inhibitor [Streptomyces sp. JV176]|uniref:SSI family serine proteinase inhibitor n=1 Tax=Streptomyces sp. JV176 TaxID=858630 RepID=UPI002E797B8C|nr:SSI family serine proteinase inhibitor [Streptomyces sp. JV176]MEE1803587.1 SSI family serine proteinase inhibitor [Streptomyces sp. JV176]
MPRLRLLVLGVAASAVLAGTPVAATGAPLAPVPLPLSEEAWPQSAAAPGDQLTVTVAKSGVAGSDGTYRLTCRPVGGTHQRARAACDRLAELAGGSQDPFAPVSRNAACTMQYGGDATARVSGTWRGRSVDASFNKKNGCEISRWRALEPVLPGNGA